MTDNQIAEIRTRCDAATPGPWDVWRDWPRSDGEGPGLIANLENENLHAEDCLLGDPEYEKNENGGVIGRIYECIPHELANANAIFIAHARSDIPALLAEIERLRAELNRWKAGRGVDDD